MPKISFICEFCSQPIKSLLDYEKQVEFMETSTPSHEEVNYKFSDFCESCSALFQVKIRQVKNGFLGNLKSKN